MVSLISLANRLRTVHCITNNKPNHNENYPCVPLCNTRIIPNVYGLKNSGSLEINGLFKDKFYPWKIKGPFKFHE